MKTIARELDARLIPAPSRHREILDAFDALPEGGSFILVTDHDPRPLYHEFRSRTPETFGWIPVEQGPARWSVEILRLKPKDDETDITTYFARDHDEIDVHFSHLWVDLSEAIANPSRPTAPLLAAFAEFDARLERHIRWEEEVLFPTVEAKSSDLAIGPGLVMREEHERIRSLKAVAARNLGQAGRDRPALERARRALEEMLGILLDHNLKEENVYYPTSDRFFTPAETAEVLRRIRSLE